MTARIRALKDYAIAVGDGDYSQQPMLMTQDLFPDERLIMSQVLRKMTHNIQEREELLQGIFNQVAVGILLQDTQGNIWKVNQTVCDILDYSEAELINQNYFNFICADDIEAIQAHLNTSVALNHSLPTVEGRCFTKNGETKWLGITMTLVKDKENNSSYFVSVIQDITARHQAEEKLIKASNYDSLTDLPNRSLFLQSLNDLLTEAQENPQQTFAVLLIDIDNFKTLNDTLGHLAGDLFLQEIAQRFKLCLRNGDLVARLGGDEFAILLPSIESVAEAKNIARRIHQKVKTPFYINQQEFITGASIGIVLNKDQSTNKTYQSSLDLLRDADIAMYTIKHNTKSGYQVFDHQMYLDVINKRQLEKELREAIKQEKLELYFQPIINLRTKKLASIESLVRWHHTQKGLLTPSQFLPLAESVGLMSALGCLILKKACQQLKHWQNQGLISSSVTMSVNVAGQQFQQDMIFTQVKEVLAITELLPQNLRLEITETVINNHISETTDILQKIRLLGVHISIDDFGTGYSSLARLKNFPIDQLKIDKSFMDDLQHNRNAQFVQAVLNLCHDLELDAVCEGVENEIQKNFLVKMNCHSGQGYYWAKPMDYQAFTKWLIDNERESGFAQKRAE
ncbi:MAG: EAL domain-containing protein [Cyanobacterium sp. T60_A2020_053]|nr:EAL domain-containing protein [Cyanobacterium sp. T60_A2020_053]